MSIKDTWMEKDLKFHIENKHVTFRKWQPLSLQGMVRQAVISTLIIVWTGLQGSQESGKH